MFVCFAGQNRLAGRSLQRGQRAIERGVYQEEKFEAGMEFAVRQHRNRYCNAVIAVTSMMSATEQPRDRSLAGFRKP
jgi:hypothetical protein